MSPKLHHTTGAAGPVPFPQGRSQTGEHQANVNLQPHTQQSPERQHRPATATSQRQQASASSQPNVASEPSLPSTSRGTKRKKTCKRTDDGRRKRRKQQRDAYHSKKLAKEQAQAQACGRQTEHGFDF